MRASLVRYMSETSSHGAHLGRLFAISRWHMTGSQACKLRAAAVFWPNKAKQDNEPKATERLSSAALSLQCASGLSSSKLPH